MCRRLASLRVQVAESSRRLDSLRYILYSHSIVEGGFELMS